MTKPTLKDKKKYVLADQKDYIILNKIYQLEKRNLSVGDRKLVKFIRTQLERDWRTPIIKLLNQLLKKYHGK